MELNLWQSPKRADLPCTLRGFLETLGGPTAIHIPGKERERSRVLVTLSHGNEPSGLQAVYEWLKEERVPRVDVAIILGAVKAALTEPMFFYRHLPDARDLNRCFSPPYTDPQGKVALAILEHTQSWSWKTPSAWKSNPTVGSLTPITIETT